MRHAPRNLTLALTASCLLLCGRALAAPTSITIVHINDSHAWLDAYGEKGRDLEPHFGGAARAATAIARIRAQSANVIALHAGDFMHGTEFFNAYFGVPDLELFVQMGFDAMAVGNHEFDFGPDFLRQVLSQSKDLLPPSTSPEPSY